MRLIFLGNDLDVKVEHELFAENFNFNKGFDVVVLYKDGRVGLRNNCTEVHHLYQPSFEPRIAFESDIHGTGGTVKVDSIETVIVTQSAIKAKSY